MKIDIKKLEKQLRYIKGIDVYRGVVEQIIAQAQRAIPTLKKVSAIDSKISKELDKALEILEEAGVSYEFSVSPLRQIYFKRNKTFDKLLDSISDEDVRYEIASVLRMNNLVFDDYDADCPGWQYSAIC